MKLLLGPIVGAVTHDKARVWIFWNRDREDENLPRCHIFKDETCAEEIGHSPFTTVSSSVHEVGGIHGVAGLANISFPSGGEKFYFKIKFDSMNENGQIYSIRPFPEIGEDIDTLSFALISCHKPSFKSEKEDNRRDKMWEYLGDKMGEHDCRFLIQAGDQIYADHEHFNAWEWSLEENLPQKRLWYYRQTYLKSWNFPRVQEVMRTFPQYMIWDDHEITNGWGSDKKHSEDPKCRKIFEEAAHQAYFEFQHCHNPDSLRNGEFYYTFNYGPIAFLFLDLRRHRDITRYNPKVAGNDFPLAGKEQWDDIRAWLNSEIVQESKILFVVSSVPVFHLSRKFGSLGIFKNDIRDQWSTPHNKTERRILLNLLYGWSEEGNKPVFILGGDVHVGTIAEIIEAETGNKIHQITSSPITNKPAWFLDWFLQTISSHFEIHLEENDQRPVKARITDRFRKRNFAVIKVQFSEQNPQVVLHMYEEGKEEPYSISFG